MKKVSLIIIILLALSMLTAEEKELEYGLGFSGGLISGSGFSFRKLNDDFGYQINLGALMDNSSECDDCFPENYHGEWIEDDDSFTDYSYGNTTHANLGINIYKPLHNGKRSKLYLLAGTAGYFFREKISEQDYTYNDIDSLWVQTGQRRDATETEFTLNLGAGFGFDYKLSENIKLNLEWPLVFSFPEDDMRIYMYIPQVGIHYYFK